VNCIAPGFILTDLNREMWQSPELQSWMRHAQANPISEKPEDVAPLAVFLASRGADYITDRSLPSMAATAPLRYGPRTVGEC